MASTVYQRATATSFQKSLIVGLMKKRELPTDVVTVMHRDLFTRAKVEWSDGMSMAHFLDGLLLIDATELIDVLRDGEEDSEDEDDD